MRRTQIQFDEEQLVHLRELAARQGESVSAVVRRAVDELIDRSGAFASNRTDVSRDHDRYLAEAFESE